MKDYWNAVRSPGSAVGSYKKHNLHRTLKLLLASAFMFSLGISVIVSKIALQAGSFDATLFAGSMLTVFSAVVLGALALGLMHQLSAHVMGGRGKYYESLTAMSLSLAAPSLGIFAASLLVFVPLIGGLLGGFIAALTFAIGLSALYRATKDLAGVDTVTSYVIISVLVFSAFIMLYAVIAFSALALAGGL